MSRITLPYSSTPTLFYKIIFPDFSEMKFGQASPDCRLWENNVSPYGPKQSIRN